MPSIPGLVYAHRGDDLYVNLFVAGRATVPLDGGGVTLTQATNYPWDGTVNITVGPQKPAEFALRVRVPGWAVGRPVPSDLYRYAGGGDLPPPTLKVNGEAVPLNLEKGFAVIDRKWADGDDVELSLPMPAHRVTANDKVEADRGRVAIERGPLVYCAEFPDQPAGAGPASLVLSGDASFTPQWRPTLLGGVTVLETAATPVRRDLSGGAALADAPAAVTLIPYYAWASRGTGDMAVWLAADPAAATPMPAPTLARRATVTTSINRPVEPLVDQRVPANSDDESLGKFHFWPRKGTNEWVEFSFDEPQTVSAVKVFWFQDEPRGECRLPASWRVVYDAGDGRWTPVEPTADDPYPTAADEFCETRFKAVRAAKLRVEIEQRDGYSTGIHEVVLEQPNPRPAAATGDGR